MNNPKEVSTCPFCSSGELYQELTRLREAMGRKPIISCMTPGCNYESNQSIDFKTICLTCTCIYPYQVDETTIQELKYLRKMKETWQKMSKTWQKVCKYEKEKFKRWYAVMPNLISEEEKEHLKNLEELSK